MFRRKGKDAINGNGNGNGKGDRYNGDPCNGNRGSKSNRKIIIDDGNSNNDTAESGAVTPLHENRQLGGNVACSMSLPAAKPSPGKATWARLAAAPPGAGGSRDVIPTTTPWTKAASTPKRGGRNIKVYFLKGVDPVTRNTLATVGDVKRLAVQALQPFYNHVSNGSFTLEVKNIKIHYHDKEKNQPGSIVGVNDEQMLPQCSKSFAAIDTFKKVPFDAWRDVFSRSTSPYVLTNPEVDLLGLNRRFTKATPIQCGLLRDHEQNFPAVRINQENHVSVSGISLQSWCTEQYAPRGTDPFAPIGEDERVGETRMSAEEYQRFVGPGHSVLGVLQTKASHGDGWQKSSSAVEARAGPVPTKLEYQGNGNRKERSRKELAAKREVILRYKLPAGTSLEGSGMSFVYDNKETGHCTLVCDNKVADSYDWTLIGDVILPRTWDTNLLPWNDCIDEVEFEKRLVKAYQPVEGQEPICMRIPHAKSLFFPKIASKLGLDYVTLKASAEPLPPRYTNNDGDDDLKRKLYCVIIIMWLIGGERGNHKSIETLGKANYSLKSLDCESRLVLLEDMKELLSECDDDDDDIIELMGGSNSTSYLPNGTTPIACLQDGIQVLEAFEIAQIHPLLCPSSRPLQN